MTSRTIALASLAAAAALTGCARHEEESKIYLNTLPNGSIVDCAQDMKTIITAPDAGKTSYRIFDVPSQGAQYDYDKNPPKLIENARPSRGVLLVIRNGAVLQSLEVKEEIDSQDTQSQYSLSATGLSTGDYVIPTG